MTIFSTRYYKINRVCMSLCGIWPEQGLLQAYVVRVVLWGSMITVIIPEMVYLHEAFTEGSIMNDVLPCFSTQLAIFTGFMKFYFLILNKSALQSAINTMRSDWVMLGDTSAKVLMHQYAARGRLITISYISCIFVAMTCFLVLPLTPVVLDLLEPLNQSRTRTTLFATDYGVDPNDFFFLITLHGYITSIILMHILWSVDTFIMIIVQHCCGLFEIVGFTLRELDTINRGISRKIENDIIFRAIRIHQHALSFAASIEGLMKNLYAVVIFINMIAISITGVQTIMNLDQPDQAMRFAAFAIGQMAHLFFNSLPGQELIDHSSRIFESIYDNNWESISVESQKSILIMLMRSRKPNSLSAGGYYELNMENFSNVMKTSMSYLTVLTSLR